MCKNVCGCTILLVTLFIGIAAARSSTRPVSTRYVQVSGEMTQDAKVATFKGVPYAAPPIGPLR
ncbi:MAG: carboxylesterase family protein [Acidobacteriaceae bacterium]|nr:carboxylesterase family protein [Acidobacteriaceae bacterium]